MVDWKACVNASDCITRWTLVLDVVPVWLSICLCMARRSASVNSIPRLSRGVGCRCWSNLALKVTLFATRHERSCPVRVRWNSYRVCLVKLLPPRCLEDSSWVRLRGLLMEPAKALERGGEREGLLVEPAEDPAQGNRSCVVRLPCCSKGLLIELAEAFLERDRLLVGQPKL